MHEDWGHQCTPQLSTLSWFDLKIILDLLHCYRNPTQTKEKYSHYIHKQPIAEKSQNVTNNYSMAELLLCISDKQWTGPNGDNVHFVDSEYRVGRFLGISS